MVTPFSTALGGMRQPSRDVANSAIPRVLGLLLKACWQARHFSRCFFVLHEHVDGLDVSDDPPGPVGTVLSATSNPESSMASLIKDGGRDKV